MKQFAFEVKDALGLHARPAGLLVREAQKFESEITLTLERSGKSASLKKLLGVMGLGVKGGDTVTVRVEGKDEQSAVETVEKWMGEHLG